MFETKYKKKMNIKKKVILAEEGIKIRRHRKYGRIATPWIHDFTR